MLNSAKARSPTVTLNPRSNGTWLTSTTATNSGMGSPQMENGKLLRCWRRPAAGGWFLFPGHVGNLGRQLDVLGPGRRHHLQFRVAGGAWRLARRRHIPSPRSDARLQAVMLRGFLVPGFHVKQGQVGMNELFVRTKFLGLVPFGDGRGIIAFAAVSHAERKLGLEMRRLFGQDHPELRDGGVVVAGAEVEHRVIVLFLLRRHKSFDKHPYGCRVTALLSAP